MIVNDKYKFVFVHIPKTAGTSIQNALKEIDGHNRKATRQAGTKHETPVEFMNRLGLDINSDMPSPASAVALRDYLFFCFVRNPWARFCSLHRYLRKGEKHAAHVPESVNDFAAMLADRDPWVMKLHSIRPQSDFVTAPVGFVGRYENLADDFAEIKRRVGIDVALPHDNSSGSFKDDYRTHLSSRSVDIIAEVYGADVRTFGYSF